MEEVYSGSWHSEVRFLCHSTFLVIITVDEVGEISEPASEHHLGNRNVFRDSISSQVVEHNCIT